MSDEVFESDESDEASQSETHIHLPEEAATGLGAFPITVHGVSIWPARGPQTWDKEMGRFVDTPGAPYQADFLLRTAQYSVHTHNQHGFTPREFWVEVRSNHPAMVDWLLTHVVKGTPLRVMGQLWTQKGGNGPDRQFLCPVRIELTWDHFPDIRPPTKARK